MFSCEYFKIFKNSFFYRTHLVADFEPTLNSLHANLLFLYPWNHKKTKSFLKVWRAIEMELIKTQKLLMLYKVILWTDKFCS